MKYYIIAGEASGDLHGSNLIKQIHLHDKLANIRCWGGQKMQAAGATLVKDYKQLAFMGFVEVLMNINSILKNLKFCKQDIHNFQPDVVVLIDYPGFNIRIAEWAKKNAYKTAYYISPQVWAWKENRVKILKKCIDKMIVILPFEKEFYKKWGYDVDYVGHPLIEVIKDFQLKNPKKENNLKRTIALLPGSRKQEIRVKLPIMLSVCNAFPDYQFVVAKAPGQEEEFYDPFLAPYKNVSAVSGQTYDILHTASAALVTSGTATLETALFKVPQVVCYKGSTLSYEIAKRVIKIKYISLVNLIMDKPVVKELIQHELTSENCIKELKDLLYNQNRKTQLQKDYEELSALLTEGGNASDNAASIIHTLASSNAMN